MEKSVTGADRNQCNEKKKFSGIMWRLITGDYCRQALFLISCVAIAAIAGAILLVLAYTLPVDQIRKNVRESLPIFQMEADNYYWAPGHHASKIDGFTDSLMLNEAAYIGTGSAVKDAMEGAYVLYPSGSQPFSDNLIKSVSEHGDANDGAVVCPYTRYWHGYLIWLKPLLVSFNYQQIRMFSMMIQLALLTALSVQLFKAFGWAGTAAFLLTSFFINPISTALSMQFASIYMLTLLASMAILYLHQRGQLSQSWKVFVICGICVAYFDFLTYPIVSLGVPLILCISLDSKTCGQGLREVVANSVLWGTSYLTMWVGKWIIASLLLGTNVIKDGINTVQHRTSDVDDFQGKVTFYSVVRKNLEAADAKAWLFVILLVLIAIPFMVCFRKYRVVITKKLVPVLAVMLYPFIWYFLVRNHSSIHDWMTFRNLAITLYGALMIMLLSVRKIKN